MFNANDHLMNLKGKAYLEVKWRLVWFREDKPNWCIDTKLEQLTENHAVFSAKIFDENGVQKSSAYGSEGIKDFGDFIEKAETKAVGRALAMLGYGTQFAPEMEEGERIVDAPVERPAIVPKKESARSAAVCAECGADVSPAVNNYSIKAFGKCLCMDCQKKAKK